MSAPVSVVVSDGPFLPVTPNTRYLRGQIALAGSVAVQAKATFVTGLAGYVSSDWDVLAEGVPGGTVDLSTYKTAAQSDATYAPKLTPTATKTAAYTAAVGELATMNVAAGGTTLTLPTGVADKALVGFRALGANSTTPLAVQRGGSDTIGTAGGTSVSAPLDGEVTIYQYDLANTRWLPVVNVKPLTALKTYNDALYPAKAHALTGIYKPTDWGQFWYPRLAAAKAGTGLARIGVVGDSVAQGYWASDLRTKSWASLLRIAAQTYATDGGSGYDGCQNSSTFLGGAGTPALTQYQTVGSAWAQTGTWSTPSNLPFGPSALLLVGGAVGSTITRPFRGTQLEVIYGNQTGAFTIAIDGGAAATVTPGSDGTIAAWTSGTLSAGAHTVVITASAATGPYLAGISGTTTTGVRLDNYGIAGAESGIWARQNGDPFISGEFAAGYRRPVDLLVIEMTGGNDVGKATSTLSVTTTSGSATLTGVNLPYGYTLGAGSAGKRTISGTGIPAGTTIASVNANGSTITMSANATASGTVTATIVNPDPVNNWAANIESYLRGVLDGSSNVGNTDLLFLIPLYSVLADSAYQFANMRARVWSLAQSYGAAVVDVGATYRQSWSKWNAAGMAGSQANPTVAGSDPAHPSDAGHAAIAALLNPVVVATS